MTIELDEAWLRCEVCGQPSELPPASCLLAQPVSVVYCRRCLLLGVEALYIVEGVLRSLLPGLVTRAEAEAAIAPWALEIIDRSLHYHGKTWEEAVVEAFADEKGLEA